MAETAYIAANRTPTPAEYMQLRAAAGLSPFSEEAATMGLAGTVFAVVIEQGNRAVGMGRVIGDGGCFFQIVDIAVDPLSGTRARQDDHEGADGVRDEPSSRVRICQSYCRCSGK